MMCSLIAYSCLYRRLRVAIIHSSYSMEQTFRWATKYVPDTVAHGQTFICCDVDIQRVESKTFLRPTLYIWVFTHKSKMRLPEGGVHELILVVEKFIKLH